MLYTFSVVLSIFASSAIAAQTNACEKFGKSNYVPLRIDPTTGQDVKPVTCLNVHKHDPGTPGAPYYTYVDGDKAAVLTHTRKVPDDVICEHIVEVQLLKQVLDTGGPCQILHDEKDAEKRKAIRDKFRKVTDILNGGKNLVFFTTKIEKQKGDMVNRAQMTPPKPYKDNPKDKNLRNRLEAVDYFVNTQTVGDSTAVAAALDEAIKDLFGEPTQKVVPRWATIRDFAHTCYQNMKPTPLELSAANNEHSCSENILVEQF